MPVERYGSPKSGVTYSEIFEQRLVARFVEMPWRKWLNQSADMQSADVAFFRQFNAMQSASESKRAKDQERKNKPRPGQGRKRR